MFFLIDAWLIYTIHFITLYKVFTIKYYEFYPLIFDIFEIQFGPNMYKNNVTYLRKQMSI